ncbi:MFS transporter [Bogoriella caseilytica]|uniref:MFS-type transporter involved in bile tolerance (Atg22 family) n=1 Tax=Bogoriella caseilytica TaxID=56055 RepID=A0A3N2B902_9MICO|nr:MFS transporter [Bogoriella caseilytica]ROR71721.1 MFS-type transporter involved in bile tolerance (Atg22 family) [Bogoriella caseilytica]
MTDAREPLGRNFRMLLPAAFSANLADGLSKIAIPWIATALTRDPMLITLVVLCSRLPWLVFSLPAGVITDRVDRRRLIVAMDAVRALMIGAFAVVVLVQQSVIPDPGEVEAGLAEPPGSAGWILAALYLTALLVGSAEVLRDNAAQTMLPAVVLKPQLRRANSRLWGAEVTADSFIGPPLAGVLLGFALVVPLGATTVLFAVAGLLMLRITGSFRAKPRPGAPAPHTTPTPLVDAAAASTAPVPTRGWTTDLCEGFRWLWDHQLLRALAISLGVMNGAMAATGAMAVLFAQEVLGLGATGFGVLATGAAAGAILGTVVAEPIAKRMSSGMSLRVVLIATVAQGLLIGLFPHPVLVWTLFAFGGLLAVLWNIITLSLRQTIIPDHLLGRVNSVYRFFGWGMMSIGALAGGVIVSIAETAVTRDMALRLPFLVAALVCAALVPYLWHRASTARIDAAIAEAEASE